MVRKKKEIQHIAGSEVILIMAARQGEISNPEFQHLLNNRIENHSRAGGEKGYWKLFFLLDVTLPLIYLQMFTPPVVLNQITIIPIS